MISQSSSNLITRNILLIDAGNQFIRSFPEEHGYSQDFSPKNNHDSSDFFYEQLHFTTVGQVLLANFLGASLSNVNDINNFSFQLIAHCIQYQILQFHAIFYVARTPDSCSSPLVLQHLTWLINLFSTHTRQVFLIISGSEDLSLDEEEELLSDLRSSVLKTVSKSIGGIYCINGFRDNNRLDIADQDFQHYLTGNIARMRHAIKQLIARSDLLPFYITVILPHSPQSATFVAESLQRTGNTTDLTYLLPWYSLVPLRTRFPLFKYGLMTLLVLFFLCTVTLPYIPCLLSPILLENENYSIFEATLKGNIAASCQFTLYQQIIEHIAQNQDLTPSLTTHLLTFLPFDSENISLMFLIDLVFEILEFSRASPPYLSIVNLPQNFNVNSHVIPILLRYNSSANFYPALSKRCDFFSFSLLQCATYLEYDDILESLAQFEGHINQQDRWGLTPLHLAVRNNSSRSVETLLRLGAIEYPSFLFHSTPSQDALRLKYHHIHQLFTKNSIK